MTRNLPFPAPLASPLQRLGNRRRSRRGQTLVEYGLIIAMVSIVAILVLISLGSSTQNIYEHINDKVDQANSYSAGS